MNMNKAVVAICLSALVVPGSVGARDRENDLLLKMLSGGPMLDEPELSQRISEAERHPLGSKNNPVRVEKPEGQREYLSSLRCGDGRVPKFSRVGNLGPGIYMSMIDDYEVDCGSVSPGLVHVIMDMYFPGHKEMRPVPGFTIALSEVSPN